MSASRAERPRLRVLMIEDDDDDAALTVAVLTRAGFQVNAVRVEEAAPLAEVLRGGLWDLVTSDWHLPRFSGRAALAIVRELAPDVPIVVVSAATDAAGTRAAALALGAAAFVPKDDLGQLVQVVDGMTGGRRR